MNNAPLIAGIELGGTKCLCILARSPDDIIEEVRIATRDPDATLADIDKVLERWQREPGFAAIGSRSTTLQRI